MEASAISSFLVGAPWWSAGAAAGLLAGVVGVALPLVSARRKTSSHAPLEADSTLEDDVGTGFRSSRFAARVCTACSQPMLLEGDGRWRCAGYPACRG